MVHENEEEEEEEGEREREEERVCDGKREERSHIGSQECWEGEEEDICVRMSKDVL